MSTFHHAPVVRNAPLHRPLSGAVLLAVLTVAAACGLYSLASSSLSPQPDVGQCTEIRDRTARLACYDAIGNATLGTPAKGANAPSLAQ